jgi:arylsulfatase A-like enzyme
MSMLTGLYPAEHGVYPPEAVLPADIPTLAELFQKEGYRTGGITEGCYVSGDFGFARGFDVFFDDSDRGPTGVRQTFDRGIQFLGQLAEKDRFFLFLHTYSVHVPYEPPEAYRSLYWPGAIPQTFEPTGQNLVAVNRGLSEVTEEAVRYYESLYDAAIRHLDDEIQRLFNELESMGLIDDMTVIITSDHGEEFMEHGGVLHARTYYREVIDVPLIVAGPGVPPGWRSDAVASHIDIAPTLLGLAGLPVPSAMDGLDLGRHWGRGPLPPEDRILFAEADHSNETSDQYRMVRTARYKLILNRRNGVARFYDLVADPDERHDVRLKHLADVNEQLAALHDFEATRVVSRRSLDLSRERREALRQLGYVE